MKYRIVTNGEWYEIEYRPWWFPIWTRLRPSRYRYPNIDWNNYKFVKISNALLKIEELKVAETRRDFEPVDKDVIELIEKYMNGQISEDTFKEMISP